MKSVAIMQPYLLPYVGYFQLMESVDTFVLLDDVQYIRRGWVNRNRILLQGTPTTVSIPVAHTHRSSLINEMRIAPQAERELSKFNKSIHHAYIGRPGWQTLQPLIERLAAARGEDLILPLLEALLIEVRTRLKLNCHLRLSSTIDHTPGKGTQRILSLVKAVGGDTYINPPGGVDLYDDKNFQDENIDLYFLKPQFPSYPQIGTTDFVSGLSILDLLAHVSENKLRESLGVPTLLTREQALSDRLLRRDDTG